MFRTSSSLRLGGRCDGAKRRELIILLGGAAAAWPLAAGAQKKRMPVIGFLSSSSPGPSAPNVAAFRQGLSETGYVEGQNLAIEYRWAEGSYDRLPTLAAELVGRKADLIAAVSTPSARAAKNATSVPIVFTGVNPVANRLVASLARPGGNVTGFEIFVGELMPKRFELLSELVPQARVIAFLVNPTNTANEGLARDMQEATRTKGGVAPHPAGQQRRRDRDRFRLPRPTAGRRDRRRQRSVLRKPA